MKQNKKQRYSIFLVVIMILAMLLAACKTGNEEQTTDVVPKTASVGSGNNSGTSGMVAVDGGESGDMFAAAFSERDLTNGYDAEGAVSIVLSGSSIEASDSSVKVSGSNATITEAGTYILSGTLSDGTVYVDADKEDKVQIVLSGADITSSDFAAIYVLQADKVFLTLADGTVNRLKNGGTFRDEDENNVDAVVFSKDDLTLNGTGKLIITSPAQNGIAGKDEVTITSGTYEITAGNHAVQAKDSLAIADGDFTVTSGQDGFHCENDEDNTLGIIYIAGGSFTIQAKDDAVHANAMLQIDGGSINITAAEGLEATYVRINGGEIAIQASDDGVNAARKSTAYTPTFEMNDGYLKVVMGPGDTDGIDANGNIVINGGTIDVTGNSTFDYDGTAQLNGGTVICNGQQVSTLPNQMMGGGRGGNFGGGGFGGNGGENNPGYGGRGNEGNPGFGGKEGRGNPGEGRRK